MQGLKTGGRVAGTPNKPKAAMSVSSTSKEAAKTDTTVKSKAARGLVITYELLDELVPYDRNPRVHSAADIAGKQRSLLEFGWTLPIAKADGGVLCGHARRQAAINLRDAGKPIPRNPDPDRAPTVDLSHLTKKQRRAYVIADNAQAMTGSWDSELLTSEVLDLQGADFDLGALGFETSRIDALLGIALPEPEPKPPAVPPSPPSLCPECGRTLAPEKAA
jgi:ParB-like chromosome segregation protein Spo0J